MPSVQRWSHRELPAALQWQAVAFIRTVWPSIDGGLVRDPYPRELSPTYYTVTHGDDLLLSMAATYTTVATAAGDSWTTTCLGNVFTFPAARGRGLGRMVVDAAARDIQDSSVDVAALLCDPALQPFYAAGGWVPAPASATVTPDGEVLGPLRMMLILSPSAAAVRRRLVTEPFHVPSPW